MNNTRFTFRGLAALGILFSLSASALEPAGTFLKFRDVTFYPNDEAIITFDAAQLYDMTPHTVRVFDTDGVATMVLLLQGISQDMREELRDKAWDTLKTTTVPAWPKVKEAFRLSLAKAVKEYEGLLSHPPKGWDEAKVHSKLDPLKAAQVALFANDNVTYGELETHLAVWLDKNAPSHTYTELYGENSVESNVYMFNHRISSQRNPIGQLAQAIGFHIDQPIASRTRPYLDVDLGTVVKHADKFPEGLCPVFIAKGRHLEE